MNYDVAVIGGGSAGYAAARTAADKGARVAIVDRGPLGGLCILRGCMPSKTLLRSSQIMSLMKRAKEFGLGASSLRANVAAINDRKKTLIRGFADYRTEQLKSPRFTLFRGKARFQGPRRLRAGTKTVEADSFVIATGSVVSRVPIPGLEEVGYITSDDALDLRKLPKSMIVLGGGPVATELAQHYCRLGTRTTLIQRSDHIQSAGDEDLARPVEARLREEGMKVFTGTRLRHFTRKGDTVTAHFEHNGRQRRASAGLVLQALGRSPNLEGLALENAGVEVRDGRIAVDERMRTSARHIYAAGDCIGQYEIVHIAIQQGEIAGHNAIKGTRKQRIDYRLRAGVAFTDPQIASAGIGEKACQREGIDYLLAKYPFDDHGKSVVMGETHGFVKILCDPRTGEILGGHIVGPDASELLHELVAIMYYRGTVMDLAAIPHYHPTLAEILTYPAEELAEQIAG
ncbi:MAG: NAD(P)/FAD-dependent oxidoreductase [Candidatus Latescibacteria bacterium]|jgi:pyruvate/2-oxoglutarate dehydrogenase complex dihydrolipoamide dehydrogenase (E3) component|nr:NAD(P)/FAD-dependent oxidoreductase [Candidatus Latescibacterota bacterium]